MLLLAFLIAGQAPPLAPPPPGRWDAASIGELIAAIRDSEAEGMSPSNYGLSDLERAAAAEDPELPVLADRSALALAHDLLEGRTGAAERESWHIPRMPVDYRSWLDSALAAGSLRASLAGLLPTAPAYQRLRAALPGCAPQPECATIRANMERWRWLPRDLGRRYLWVNIPAYRLDLVENGQVVASHKVIVGKLGTRTPVFRTDVTGITINPWWNVPCSIVDESVGRLIRTNPRKAARLGYVATRGKDGKLQVRQKPGPQNSLGRIKLEMPNPYAVYIHDTPAKKLFVKDVRAYSHGCIRTEEPDRLAKALLGPAMAPEVDRLLLFSATRTLKLPQPLPTYVIYMTAEPGDGSQIVRHADIYRRDAALIASR